MAGNNRNPNPASSKKKKVGAGIIILRVIGTLILIGGLAFGIFCYFFYNWVKADVSKQTYINLDDYALDLTSVIYYQDRETGEWEELQKLYATQNRVWTDYEKIPKELVFACVSIEDKRFYEHEGVDWLRTVRACASMFIGKSSFGGSTITQQLIKNLTGNEEVTVRRKLTEIYRALRLEEDYPGKERIMEMYLNTIYFGERCFGVEAASLNYFGKDVWDLTLAECASLIGITNNPSKYDPYVYPENNRKRQLTILGCMLDQGYIDQATHDKAAAQEMVFKSADSSIRKENGSYSYFVDQVYNDVVSDMMAKTGYSYDVVTDLLTSGGYSIYSTVDIDVQKALEAVFEDRDGLPETESSQLLQGAMEIIDNKTGDVVGLIGGTGKKEASLLWNRATQSRLQPGSVIKPLTIYATALENGLITPATVMDDTPTRFVDSGNCWPLNIDRIYRGLVDMRTAVAKSLNTIPMKIMRELGGGNDNPDGPEASDAAGARLCYEFARDHFGLSTFVEERGDFTDLTLWGMGLGSLTDGLRLSEITEAYAGIYNKGVQREARTYTKVVDKYGNVVLEKGQESTQSVSEKNAWYLTYMMRETVENGTGTAAALSNMPVAGKTGTTEDDFDYWFAGYTPYYTGVTWVGYDTPEAIEQKEGNSNIAVTLWNRVMEKVHENKKRQEFWQPSYIVECEYCPDSGMLVTDACKADPRGERITTGLLAIEDAPTEECRNHRMISICTASGCIATEYCREQFATIRKVGMLNVPRFFPIDGIVVQDQQYNYVGTVPEGMNPARSTVPNAMSEKCYIHIEEVEAQTLEELIEEELRKQEEERQKNEAQGH